MTYPIVITEIIKVLGVIAGTWLTVRSTDRWRKSKRGFQIQQDIVNRYKDLMEHYKKSMEENIEQRQRAEADLEKWDIHWKNMYDTLMKNYIGLEQEHNDLKRRFNNLISKRFNNEKTSSK